MGELGLCKVLTSHVDPAAPAVVVDLDDGSAEGDCAEAGPIMRFVLSLQLDGQ